MVGVSSASGLRLCGLDMELLEAQSCFSLASHRILHAVPAPRTMSLICYITHVQFGFAAIQLLKSKCQRIGISRPFIVTNPGVKAASLIGRWRVAGLFCLGI